MGSNSMTSTGSLLPTGENSEKFIMENNTMVCLFMVQD